MKIGLISDIHHGSHSAEQSDWSIIGSLTRALEHLDREGADILLDLGDRLTEAEPESDRKRLSDLVNCFSRFDGRRFHILGNHDVEALTITETAAVLDCPLTHASYDFDDVQLITWQPSTKFTAGHGFDPVGQDLDWLVEALASNAKPAIVATHVPMSKQAMTGNHYFENNNQSLSTYPDHARVRAAVEATGKAAVWISGHVHWNSFTTIRGIHHLTMQSFSERSMTFPNPAEAYGLLEIGTDSITYQVFGRDPLTLKLPFSRGPMGHRRLPIPAVDPR